MPSPQWLGMRPNRSIPMGVMYSPQTRLTTMESVKLFCPACGAHCVLEKAPTGVSPPRCRTV